MIIPIQKNISNCYLVAILVGPQFAECTWFAFACLLSCLACILTTIENANDTGYQL